MKIFVTDEGTYWNHKTPILERYADSVVIVCLDGKKVTDQYECIVSPYRAVGLGMDHFGISSAKFQALKSIEQELWNTYGQDDKLIFLSDHMPESLYPYLILRDQKNCDSMHLWCMSPYKFEPYRRKKAFVEMLQDLSGLHSLLYTDSDMIWEMMDPRDGFPELHKKCETFYSELLPQVLDEIDTKLSREYRYYFDFVEKRYIKTDAAFHTFLSNLSKELQQKDERTKYHSDSSVSSQKSESIPKSGSFPLFPFREEAVKREVSRLIPRSDGKQVCESLKKMRKELADANHISFEFVDCPSTGPCAGTCPQCDQELLELQAALMNIPEEERVYPAFGVFQGGKKISSVAADRIWPDEKIVMGYLTKQVPGGKDVE